MNKQIHHEQLQSSDLALVAFVSLSFPIESIDKSNPRKVIFSFSKSSKLEKLIQAYWRREARVEPRAYFDQLRSIKARIYERGGKKYV